KLFYYNCYNKFNDPWDILGCCYFTGDGSNFNRINKTKSARIMYLNIMRHALQHFLKIFMLSYSPMLNPIEEMLSLWKNNFRKLRLRDGHMEICELIIESEVS